MKHANKCSRDVVRFPTHLLLEVTFRYRSVGESDYLVTLVTLITQVTLVTLATVVALVILVSLATLVILSTLLGHPGYPDQVIQSVTRSSVPLFWDF